MYTWEQIDIHRIFPFQKQKLQQNGVPKLVKKKLLTPDKIKQLKSKKLDERRKSTTVNDLLREKREELNMSIPPDLVREENGECISESHSLINVETYIQWW